MKKNTLSLLVFNLVIFSSLISQSDFKTKSVTLFKSGVGFFQKEATVKTSDRIFKIRENYPKSTFGTLWFSSPNDRLESVTYAPDTLISRKEIENREDHIKANTGKEVTLILSDVGNQRTLTGTIENVKPGYIEFKTDNNWRLISTRNILEIQFSERPVGTKTEKKEVPAIELKFSGKGKKEPVEMMYLNKEIGWFPNYKLTLKSKTSATLKFQAMVINDAEDIKNADIHFVVGVPNFKFKHIPSIFTADIMLQNIMQFLGQNPREQFSITSNALMGQVGSDYGNSDAVVPSTEQSGQQEDLFYYSLKNISLNKGGRATYDIFEKDIPIEHRYTVDLPDNTGRNYHNNQQDLFKKHPVKHKICIENPGDTPFTSGSLLIMNEAQDLAKPLAQSLLHFTSAGGDSKTEITLATDIRVNESLKESERLPNAKRWNDHSWNRIKLQGKITIRNYKNEAVKMEISKTISGELLNSNVKWKIQNHRLSYRTNPNIVNDLTWTFEINAGEEKEIEYEYYIWKR